MRCSLFARYAALCCMCLVVSCTVGPKVQDGAVLTTNANVRGCKITVRFTRGTYFAHVKQIGFVKLIITPQIAVWAEDTQGRYLQTLYVTHKFAKQDWGVVPHNKDSCFRTSSLPYWLNKYLHAGNKAPTTSSPLPDAVTAATPAGCFDLNTTLAPASLPVIVKAEVNSSFDYNEAFGAKRQASHINGQPALVYIARIGQDPRLNPSVSMHVAGHSGETGADSLLHKDISGITTAMNIFSCINVLVVPSARGFVCPNRRNTEERAVKMH